MMLATFVILACAAPSIQNATLPALPETQGAWLLELRTDGGRAGRGWGAWAIYSDGRTFVAGYPDATRVHQFGPSASLTEGQLAPFRNAVQAARMAGWKSDYGRVVPDGGILTVRLRLRGPKGMEDCSSGLALDGELSVPADLRRLWDLLSEYSQKNPPKR